MSSLSPIRPFAPPGVIGRSRIGLPPPKPMRSSIPDSTDNSPNRIAYTPRKRRCFLPLASQKPEQTAPLFCLPDELIIRILLFTGPIGASGAAQTCEKMNAMANDEVLWVYFCRDLGIPAKIDPINNWKRVYQHVFSGNSIKEGRSFYTCERTMHVAASHLDTSGGLAVLAYTPAHEAVDASPALQISYDSPGGTGRHLDAFRAPKLIAYSSFSVGAIGAVYAEKTGMLHITDIDGSTSFQVEPKVQATAVHGTNIYVAQGSGVTVLTLSEEKLLDCSGRYSGCSENTCAVRKLAVNDDYVVLFEASGLYIWKKMEPEVCTVLEPPTTPDSGDAIFNLGVPLSLKVVGQLSAAANFSSAAIYDLKKSKKILEFSSPAQPIQDLAFISPTSLAAVSAAGVFWLSIHGAYPMWLPCEEEGEIRHGKLTPTPNGYLLATSTTITTIKSLTFMPLIHLKDL